MDGERCLWIMDAGYRMLDADCGIRDTEWFPIFCLPRTIRAFVWDDLLTFKKSHPVETGRRLLIVPFKINASVKASQLYQYHLIIHKDLFVEVG